MTGDSTTTRADPPPLRLVHLLLYMAVCSVYLSVAVSPQLASPPLSMRKAADPRYRRIIAVPDAMLDAATTTVFVLLVVWSFRRRRVWDQPGHWIAIGVTWQMISLHCVLALVALAKWLAGVQSVDDMIRFWEWGKGIYALQYLPVALLFICIAVGWRGVANTWPWRFYFASIGVWLLASATVSHLPFDWTNVIRSSVPEFIYSFLGYRLWQLSSVLLLLAMINDIRPGKPRRHWSHWIPACHPLLAQLFRYLPLYVWDFLHPAK